MGIGTYEQYKERLLKMKPNVYLNGKCVDRSNGKEGAERDLADWIKGGTYVMKQCYDVANNPRYEDVCGTSAYRFSKGFSVYPSRLTSYTYTSTGMASVSTLRKSASARRCV